MEVSHGARPSQMPNVHVGPLFCRVHITRRKVAQMQHGVDVNLRKLHESERLLSQLPVSPFEVVRFPFRGSLNFSAPVSLLPGDNRLTMIPCSQIF